MTIQKLFTLEGKVCLMTGATGHLGAAMAAALAEAGASVIATSRKLDAAESLAANLPTQTGSQRHHGLELDQLSSEISIKRAFDRAIEKAGYIDVLINNAHEPIAADLTEVTGEQFNRQLANATGYFLLARHLHDHAVGRSTPANVIFLGSMYGVAASYPDAYREICSANPVAYQVLKGGVIQMARHLAVYWAKDGVRVNALSPGPFPSPKADKRLLARLKKKTPMNRIGTPDELKGAIVFLASDASSFITGHNLVVDGGWTAW